MNTQNFSDFLVFVDYRQWDAARAGDKTAREAIASQIDGIDIYFHAYPCGPNEIGLSIADLICVGIVQRVTLHRDS